MSFWRALFGDEGSSFLKKSTPLVQAVAGHESRLKGLSNDELKSQTVLFKERLASGEALDSLLTEAFATVREAAARTLKQRHFDVQIQGGIVLHQGNIAEMRTGEGKTLVATLPAYLNALEGKGVHIVTVNDYLSRRDAVWMGQVYHALGMTVGVLNHESSYVYDPAHVPQSEESTDDRVRDELGAFKVVHEYLRPCARGEAYGADITYGTNNEFGFDYLRDNLEYEAKNLRQREHAYAIVDEIDSILIDEARTPLIISAAVSDAENLYERFASIARSLVPEEDYTVDEKHRQIMLTDSGVEKAQEALGIENIYTDAGIKHVHHLEIAVKARALYGRDKEYVVKDGQIIIVDESTGRLQPGRRWSDGLHQAIEAKEGVSIQQESRTFASITFQNYFRLYKKLSGMTGTAVTSSEEFYKVYGLNTVSIPTNKPSQRIDHDDFIFQNESGKMKAIARAVRVCHEKGQPVLVGTVSVEKNELLSAHFRSEGIPHEILNAKNHEREGEIIAQAGKRGAVTIATNMAGRGVDIKLGGNPASPEEYTAVKNAGGLFVLGTERHEARRIDNQLRGRSGRQGDSGETQFFVSLEDSLMRVFASDTIKRVMGTLKLPEDEPIHTSMITRALEKAQIRIEELNFDARKHVLAYDDVLNIQRTSVYARRRMLLAGDNESVEEEIRRISGSAPELESACNAKRAELGEAFIPTVRRLLLQGIDFLWVEHLESMEYLRSSVSLRAYGQRDPLVEYKKEGLRLFRSMEEAYAGHIARIVPNLSVSKAEGPRARPALFGGTQVKSYNRNDRVVITNGTEKREMKYKKAERLLEAGQWRIIEA
ncbi:MAG TPA: preprotein translocase subunit SecA [Candidatus Paceibacterota bacterium]